MGVVLAIDPGRRQTKAIERLTADLAGHEVLVAASGDEAIDLLDRHVPDLLLFPIGLSPSDEARLRARLDGLGRPTDLKALTLPLRAFLDVEHQASRPTAAPPRWFYWFKPATAVDYDVDDPRRFADAVRSDLDRPRVAAAPRALDEVPEPPLAAHARQNEQSDHRQPWQSASSAPSTSDGPGGANAIAFDPRPASDPGADAWAAPADPFAGASAAASVAETLSSPSTAPGSLEAFEPPALEDGEPRPGRISVLVSAAAGMAARAAASLGPAAAAAWRIARTMPRPVQVAAPVLIILLTLGVTGRAGAMLRAPVRWAAATKARFFPDKPRTGTAEIQSVPDGAEVWMEGRQIGVTPLRAEFAVGSHEVELRHKGTTRSLILDVLPGATVVQRIEWAAPRAAVGRLRVESEPAGASVSVDGKTRGVTPLDVTDLAAGRHTVELTHKGNSVRESVDVKANRTTTLRTSVYQGWLALFSPIDVQIALDGRPLTLDDQNRALLPAGPHELTIQNRTLGFTETQTLSIRPGDTTAISVTLPKTALTVTATGPAEVFLDGSRIGDVPIVDLEVEIGTHDILLQSPEHGERRLAITATVEPVRVAIDFASPTP